MEFLFLRKNNKMVLKPLVMYLLCLWPNKSGMVYIIFWCNCWMCSSQQVHSFPLWCLQIVHPMIYICIPPSLEEVETGNWHKLQRTFIDIVVIFIYFENCLLGCCFLPLTLFFLSSPPFYSFACSLQWWSQADCYFWLREVVGSCGRAHICQVCWLYIFISLFFQQYALYYHVVECL